MDKKYVVSDRDGSLTLYRKGQILVAEFSGAISEYISERFCETISLIAPEFNFQPWGYCSHSQNLQAATPDAERNFVKAYTLSQQLGCCAEAYVIHSPVGLAQVDKVRRACGLLRPIAELNFEQVDQAEHFINLSLGREVPTIGEFNTSFAQP